MTAAPSADTPSTAAPRPVEPRPVEPRPVEPRRTEGGPEESVLPEPGPGEPVQAARRVVPPAPGLEGWGKGLAVVFWTAFLITVLVLAGSAAVTTSSRFLAALCGEGCDGGYRLDDLLRTSMVVAEPCLAVVALVAWALARRPPRRAGHVLYGLVAVAQLALLAWALWSTYQLFLA